MDEISTQVLRRLLDATTEPLVLIRVDSPDWPVVLSNPAFDALADDSDIIGTPFPDVLAALVGREMSREASVALRTLRSATLPVDVGSREYLLTLLPIEGGDGGTPWFGAFLRTAGRHVPAGATRRVRDLSGDDAVTGLLNERAFRDLLEHDWAVASREDRILGLTAFNIRDFEAYRGAFGAHGGDSCLRRISSIISRHLRRASDVAARIDGPAGGFLLVLSHGSGAEGLDEFAERIATSVRGLGLHHPRSRGERFVTLAHRSLLCRPRIESGRAGDALGRLVSGGDRQG